jgi:DNA-binding MarR family transcriptional regulator
MADLADALAVTPRNVTALVDGLEAEGLIRRVPHSTDRRVTLVELTCSSDRVESQFRAFQDSIGGLFADLDEDDRRTLLRLLTTLRSNRTPRRQPVGSIREPTEPADA